MNQINLAIGQEAEEFQRHLDALCNFYQRQALLAGVLRAKQDWDKLNASQRVGRHTLTPRAKRLAVAAILFVSLFLFLQNHSSLPSQKRPPAHSRPHIFLLHRK